MTWLLVDVLIAPGQQSPESRQFARKHVAALHASGAGLDRTPDPRLPAQPVVRLGAGLLRPVLGLHLAHPLGLRDPHRRPERARRRLCRHLALRQHHPRHGPVGSARRLRRAERGAGRPSPPDPGLHRRRRLRRHRRRPDGPQPSHRHRAGGPAVRSALPGRLRTGVRFPVDQPGDGGGDPGPGDPVRRRPGKPVPPPDRSAVPPHRPQPAPAA